jgi:hypothetical protein
MPMDNTRSSLDIKYVNDICPDKDGMSRTQLYELGIDMSGLSSSCDSGIHQI